MKKSKITLVLPILRGSGISMMSQAGAEHLGLGYLTAVLRENNYDVDIKNFQLFTMVNQWKDRNDSSKVDEISIDESVKEILDSKPDIVGISVTGPTMDECLEISKKIKEVSPEITIVFGGHQVSVMAEDIIKNEKNIDYIIIGDAEFTFLNFIKALDEGTDISSIKGVCYLRDNKVVNTGFPEDVNLDELPFPVRDSLDELKKYLNVKEARLSTSRGCYDACTFCIDSTLYKKNKWTARSAHSVVDEMEFLNKEYGIEGFWIIDDNFLNFTNKSQERARVIGEEILKRNLDIWYRAYFRADGLDRAEELLPLLRKSGLRVVHIGFESGCQTRLDYFRKRTKVSHYYRIVELLKENNIGLQVGFIIFDPFTNFENIRDDTKFLFDIGEMYLLFNFVQNLLVFPGTAIYDQLKAEGLIFKELTYNSTFKVYDYRDNKVKRLAEQMESIYNLELINADKELQRLNIITIPNILYKLRCGENSGNDKVNNIVKNFTNNKDQLLETLNQFNYDLFLDIVGMAEGEWDQSFFDAKIGEITTEIVKTKDKLVILCDEFCSTLINNKILSESDII
ncbi:B12-binding domain-containing radical SAM protein [Alkaliphilus hydrothermalis]|uniref:Radical SAM superfamily enzyme YgiQ (UPF0313 family) n=1 Tax=Alkaliphilus hydrothermalis TaxID=1482730 RepID=A0ABS2NTU7_9FIRM|nr:radical SAM protein [Alkaliphilus hydrothermalis]MBM7616202.1 radical SAM superfamily enzyme YgiQ (UPF0313 family) [Alkaliphilus hydrothermalis]